VTSMSGQTIEIINTTPKAVWCWPRALVVAKKFKPKFMVDLATLTGAIMVAPAPICRLVLQHRRWRNG